MTRIQALRAFVRLLFAVIMLASATTFAADPRVKIVTFDPASIIEVIAGKFPVLIELPAGETPVAVVSDGNGNDESKKTWDISFKKGESFVVVQPLAAAKPAQLIIRAAKNSYLFDLIPDFKAGIQTKERVAKVIIQAPPPKFSREELDLLTLAIARVREEKTRPKVTDDAPTQKAAASAPATPATPACTVPPRRNEKYTLEVVKVGADISPRDVFDDGRMTYMRFPNNLPVPVVYRSIPGQEDERLVNTHMQCDFLVLHGVAPLWNLRLGTSMVGVFNEDFDEEGIAPAKGSAVAGVERMLK